MTQKLNPELCMLDYFFKESITLTSLTKKSLQLEFPTIKRTYIRKCPDFEEDPHLAASVVFIKTCLEELYDMDGITVFVDELATKVSNESISAVTFIINLEDKILTLLPFMHNSSKDDIIQRHLDHIEKIEKVLKETVTTSEAKDLFIDVVSHEMSIKFINRQE